MVLSSDGKDQNNDVFNLVLAEYNRCISTKSKLEKFEHEVLELRILKNQLCHNLWRKLTEGQFTHIHSFKYVELSNKSTKKPADTFDFCHWESQIGTK